MNKANITAMKSDINDKNENRFLTLDVEFVEYNPKENLIYGRIGLSWISINEQREYDELVKQVCQ